MQNSANFSSLGITLSRFANEVLSRGPESVLPQNLNIQWLETLQKMADNFLDTSFEDKPCTDPADTADPVLTACVSEILESQKVVGIKLSKKELVEKTAIYCIALTIETLRRQAIVDIESPTLENIFSADRLKVLKKMNPDLGKFYKKVCIGITKSD